MTESSKVMGIGSHGPDAVIERRFAAYFAHWDIRLPPGATRRQEPGTIGKAGWMIRYVFGTGAEGFYLEFYAAHRMTNDRRVRIFGSGEMRSLEALRTMYGFRPEIPGDQERSARENREWNVRIAEELEALGLYPHGNINAYLATHDVPSVVPSVEYVGPDEHAVSFADPDELMDEIDRIIAGHR